MGSSVLLGLRGLACALVVSACGSTSTASPQASSSSGTTTTGTSTNSGGFAAYRNCLQQQGVTLPQRGGFGGGRGGGGGGGFGGGGGQGTGPTGPAGGGRPTLTPAQQKAYAACASLRPSGGFGFGGGGFNSSNPAFAKFQACLKQHGVQTGSSNERSSPAFQSALAACRSLLPAGGFGGGTGAGGDSNSSNPAFAQFQACLKQHGVQTGAAGQTPAKTQAAIAACRSVLPNGGNGTGAGSATVTPGTTTTG